MASSTASTSLSGPQMETVTLPMPILDCARSNPNLDNFNLVSEAHQQIRYCLRPGLPVCLQSAIVGDVPTAERQDFYSIPWIALVGASSGAHGLAFWRFCCRSRHSLKAALHVLRPSSASQAASVTNLSTMVSSHACVARSTTIGAGLSSSIALMMDAAACLSSSSVTPMTTFWM